MKYVNSAIMITALSLSANCALAVTVVEGSSPEKSTFTNVSSERTIRGTLIARFSDGRIDTSKGSFSTRSVEVKDHRPIDDWYKTPTDAQVSLYFEGERLTRVVIY